MKLIKSIVRPNKVDDVEHALTDWRFGMTVAEVRGHGEQKGHTATIAARKTRWPVAQDGDEVVVADSVAVRCGDHCDRVQSGRTAK